MEHKKNSNYKKQTNKKFGSTFDRRKLLDPKSGQIIGITGGIATGKSFVLECLKSEGFEVFSADEAVHQLLLKDGLAYKQVAALCPEAITETGVDRKILGEKIFSNPEKLKKLEAILHPLVRDEQVKFRIKVKQTSGKSLVFEVPLLFENNRENFYDQIILTTCPGEIQKKRAMMRKNMTEEKFESIIKLQIPDKLKFKKAHFVIKTGRTTDDTINQVKRIIFNDQKPRDSIRHRNNRPNSKRPPARDSVHRAEKQS